VVVAKHDVSDSPHHGLADEHLGGGDDPTLRIAAEWHQRLE
jgi:hypothetical protein